MISIFLTVYGILIASLSISPADTLLVFNKPLRYLPRSLLLNVAAHSSHKDTAKFTLASFSSEIISSSKVIGLVHDWARDTVSPDEGSAIQYVLTDTGSSIVFSVAEGSRLDILVQSTESSVNLQSALFLNEEDARRHSLIRFSAQNLLDSVTMFVGEEILKAPSAYTTPQGERDGKQQPTAPPKVQEKKSLTSIIFEHAGAGASERVEVMKFLSRWGTKYSSRGIGVTVSPTSDGLIVTFVSD